MSTRTAPPVDINLYPAAHDHPAARDTVGVPTSGDSPRVAPAVAAAAPVALDVLARVLRCLVPVTEPAAAFAVLAQMGVPALGDECLVELAEVGVAPYRLRSPAVIGEPATRENTDVGGASAVTQRLLASTEPILLNGATVSVAIIEADPGGANYVGALTCTRHNGTVYSETDARLVQLLVERAIATVRHARRERQAVDTEVATLKIALTTNRTIGVATGIVMATHHCTATDAFELLRTTSQHTNRKLHAIATDVTLTGALP